MKIFKKSKITNFILLVVWLSLFSNFMNKGDDIEVIKSDNEHVANPLPSNINSDFFLTPAMAESFANSAEDLDWKHNDERNEIDLINASFDKSNKEPLPSRIIVAQENTRLVSKNNVQQIVELSKKGDFKNAHAVGLQYSQDTMRYFFR